MPITSLDQLAAALPGQAISFIKGPSGTVVVGAWYSAWQMAGAPGAAAAPSSGVAGEVVTSANVSAPSFVNGGAARSYLAKLSAVCTQPGILMLYDRLWQNSGLSPTDLTAQAVASVALPSRVPAVGDASGELFDALGRGVEAWFSVYATMGAGATAPTISYTNEAGVAGRTGSAMNFATTAGQHRQFPFSLQAGDYGVRSIQTYTNAATLTSGTFGLVLRRKIAAIPVLSNVGTLLDWASLGLPVVPDDAALELLWIPSATTTSILSADAALVQR